DWLGVNSLDEALLIRGLGIDKAVAILGHTELDRLPAGVSDQLRQGVYPADLPPALLRSPQKQGTAPPRHLNVETGDHRQGVAISDLAEFVRRIIQLPNLDIEGVYTHFANIEDTLDASFAQSQIETFRQALVIMKDAGAQPSWIHASATAGALLYPETGF